MPQVPLTFFPMARRHHYASFLTDGGRTRGSVAGFEGDIGIGRLVLPLVIVAFLAVSIYWWGFRDADDDVGRVLTLEDATIPTLLLPAGVAVDDAGLLLAGVSIECETTPEQWPTFQGSGSREGCTDAPTITTPKIMWSQEVGISGWLNSPIVANNTVYVGSAGVLQGVPDRLDGVYAIDLGTGERKAYFQATHDVNGVAFGNGIVVATGDEGRVWGLSASDMELVWEEQLGVAVFGHPLVIDDMVVVGDADGYVTAYEIRTGTRLWQKQVDGAVRGGASTDGEIIVVAGENRDVVAFDLSGEIVWRREVRSQDTAGALARIYSAPTIVGDLVVITLLREDLFAEPAIAALDKATGDEVWRARDAAGLKNDWGNIRSSPAHVGDLLVYGEAYSDRLIALDALSGDTVWDTVTGSYCYPHWPSPVVVSGQVVLPRHDGGLYAVSVVTGQVEWRIFLGDHGGPGTFPPEFGAEFCQWGPEDSYSILSSPAVAPNGVILVGTLEGWLYAIGDRSW